MSKLKKLLEEEKEIRIKYQNIVYKLCNIVDRRAGGKCTIDSVLATLTELLDSKPVRVADGKCVDCKECASPCPMPSDVEVKIEPFEETKIVSVEEIAWRISTQIHDAGCWAQDFVQKIVMKEIMPIFTTSVSVSVAGKADVDHCLVCGKPKPEECDGGCEAAEGRVDPPQEPVSVADGKHSRERWGVWFPDRKDWHCPKCPWPKKTHGKTTGRCPEVKEFDDGKVGLVNQENPNIYWDIESTDDHGVLEFAGIPKHSGRKYLKLIASPLSGVQSFVDVYAVLDAYSVTSQPVGHAVKKLLMAGQRGGKDRKTDLQEAIDALQRAVQMEGGAE